jgi:UDP-glucose 4-epimerase
VATFADPTLIEATLGWRATRSLDDIVASAWRWHEQHPDGYDDRHDHPQSSQR